MAQTRFSVIISCSHSAKSLKATLRALAEIKHPAEMEIVVLDDGVHEGREEAVSSFRERGMPLRHLSLPGVSKAESWNIAVRESTGEYLAFLDDDCLPSPGWLQAYSSSFERWVAGVAGGPDEVPPQAGRFERLLDYVLTSFVGTLGMRRGSNRLVRYYPRPWNMAARREAVQFAGGFDESAAEAPEVPMIQRMEKIGYKAIYQPDALVWHFRRTDLLRFLKRDLRLAVERSRQALQPGMARAYTVIAVLLGVLLLISLYPGSRPIGLSMLGILLGSYGLVVGASAIHAAVRHRMPSAVVFLPLLIVMHHAAHLTGYLFGRFTRRFARLCL